jgi:predicted phosphohydrolase
MTLTVHRISGKSTVFSVPYGKEPVSGKEAARHLLAGYADLVASRCHPGDRLTNYGNERYAYERHMAKIEAASKGFYVFTDDAYDYIPSALCVHDGWILESTGYLEESSPVATKA